LTTIVLPVPHLADPFLSLSMSYLMACKKNKTLQTSLIIDQTAHPPPNDSFGIREFTSSPNFLGEPVIDFNVQCSPCEDVKFSHKNRDNARRVTHVSKSVDSKMKTELCRTFKETGHCRYGNKCHFAHGPQELRKVHSHSPCQSLNQRSLSKPTRAIPNPI